MGFWDLLLGVAEIADALSDKDTYFEIKCKTLEVFELGASWVGTARVHGAGKHLKTEKVDFSSKISMPHENPSHSTKRDVLRKNLLKWTSNTFANDINLSKESIVLNPQENCLSCEGFGVKIGDSYKITTDSSAAECYISYKLIISKDSALLGHEELDYYFKAETTAKITSVDVKKVFSEEKEDDLYMLYTVYVLDFKVIIC